MKLDRTATNENEYPVLKPGTYAFEVKNAEHTTSSTGNWMWKLTLQFEQENGPDVTVFDYLVENDKNMWKFNSFLDCLGSNLEDTNKLADCIGEVGKASVEIEEGKNGYSDRNRVKRYLPKEEEKKPAKPSDDLPF